MAEEGKSTLKSSYDEVSGVYTTAATPPVQIPLHPHLDFVSYLFSKRFSSSSDDQALGDVALIDATSGRSLTRGQIRASIENLASGMQQRLGIQHGDVVMLLLPNMLDHPIIFNAILMLGAVATSANVDNVASELVWQVEASKPKVIFTTSAGMRKVRCTGLPIVMVAEEEDEDHDEVNSVIHLGEVYAASLGVPPKPSARIRQSDPATLLYSAGTTGVSKGVITSHGNLIAALAIASRVQDEVSPWDVMLPTFQMCFMGGMFWLCCSFSSQLVFLRRYTIAGLLSAIETHRVTSVVTTPPIVLHLLNSASSDRDISSLESLLCAGAPLGKDTMQAILSKLPHITKFIQLYGMTETTTIATGGRGPLGSTGLLKPCCEAKVVDLKTLKPLPPFGRGELLVRGPFVMQGYLGNPSATLEAVDQEGWLHTGDLVYFDDKGNLFIVERLKEHIKCNGFQVAPAELEEILLTHPDIEDCAVVPFPDEAAGEIPLACIVTRPCKELTSQEVMDFVASRVSAYRRVRKVVFLESIPKSSAGKILKNALRLQGVSSFVRNVSFVYLPELGTYTPEHCVF